MPRRGRGDWPIGPFLRPARRPPSACPFLQNDHVLVPNIVCTPLLFVATRSGCKCRTWATRPTNRQVGSPLGSSTSRASGKYRGRHPQGTHHPGSPLRCGGAGAKSALQAGRGLPRWRRPFSRLGFLPIHSHPPAFQTRISNNGDKAGVPPRVDTTANSVCSYLESALTVCPSAALIYACSRSRPPLRIDRTSGLTREQISGVHGGSYPPGFQG